MLEPKSFVEHVRWVPIKNDSGEEIPPHGICLISEIDNEGAVHVVKPNANSIQADKLLANSGTPVKIGGYGAGSKDWPTAVFCSNKLITAGVEVGTKNGSWELNSEQCGFYSWSSQFRNILLVKDCKCDRPSFGTTTIPYCNEQVRRVQGGYFPNHLGVIVDLKENAWNICYPTSPPPCVPYSANQDSLPFCGILSANAFTNLANYQGIIPFKCPSDPGWSFMLFQANLNCYCSLESDIFIKKPQLSIIVSIAFYNPQTGFTYPPIVLLQGYTGSEADTLCPAKAPPWELFSTWNRDPIFADHEFLNPINFMCWYRKTHLTVYDADNFVAGGGDDPCNP